jgi:hypothetical protein
MRGGGERESEEKEKRCRISNGNVKISESPNAVGESFLRPIPVS